MASVDFVLVDKHVVSVEGDAHGVGYPLDPSRCAASAGLMDGRRGVDALFTEVRMRAQTCLGWTQGWYMGGVDYWGQDRQGSHKQSGSSVGGCCWAAAAAVCAPVANEAEVVFNEHPEALENSAFRVPRAWGG